MRSDPVLCIWLATVVAAPAAPQVGDTEPAHLDDEGVEVFELPTGCSAPHIDLLAATDGGPARVRLSVAAPDERGDPGLLGWTWSEGSWRGPVTLEASQPPTGFHLPTRHATWVEMYRDAAFAWRAVAGEGALMLPLLPVERIGLGRGPLSAPALVPTCNRRAALVWTVEDAALTEAPERDSRPGRAYGIAWSVEGDDERFETPWRLELGRVAPRAFPVRGPSGDEVLLLYGLLPEDEASADASTYLLALMRLDPEGHGGAILLDPERAGPLDTLGAVLEGDVLTVAYEVTALRGTRVEPRVRALRLPLAKLPATARTPRPGGTESR